MPSVASAPSVPTIACSFTNSLSKSTYWEASRIAHSSALPLLILPLFSPRLRHPGYTHFYAYHFYAYHPPPSGFNNPFTMRGRAMMVCFLALLLSTVKRGSQVFFRGGAARNLSTIVTANVWCRPADTACFDYRVSEPKRLPRHLSQTNWKFLANCKR